MTKIEKSRKASPLWVRKFAAFFAMSIAAAAGGASSAVAQSESLVYSFAGGTSDGANPYAGLTIDSSGNLYGATFYGGSSGAGTVFEYPSGGPNDMILCNLPGGTGSVNGAGAYGTPILPSSGTIYGTASYNSFSGGSGVGGGVVYSCISNGTNYSYTNLYGFGGTGDGANPFAGVVTDGTYLYGTTALGGASSDGTIYKLPLSGVTETWLYSFKGYSHPDGASPYAGVILISSNIYGTTELGGGPSNVGEVFQHPVSSGTPVPVIEHAFSTSSNGNDPRAGLVTDGSGNLYGTTWLGGNASGDGVAFKLTPNGLGTYAYSVMHTFAGGTGDGANPEAGLVFDSTGTNLYGTTTSGGAYGYGVVFELSPSGTSYTESLIHSFAGGTTDGANPYAALVCCDASGNLYGTTVNGGASGKGVIFEITPAAALTPKH